MPNFNFLPQTSNRKISTSMKNSQASNEQKSQTEMNQTTNVFIDRFVGTKKSM